MSSRTVYSTSSLSLSVLCCHCQWKEVPPQEWSGRWGKFGMLWDREKWAQCLRQTPGSPGLQPLLSPVPGIWSPPCDLPRQRAVQGSPGALPPLQRVSRMELVCTAKSTRVKGNISIIWSGSWIGVIIEIWFLIVTEMWVLIHCSNQHSALTHCNYLKLLKSNTPWRQFLFSFRASLICKSPRVGLCVANITNEFYFS